MLFCFISGRFHVNLGFSGPVVLQEIFKTPNTPFLHFCDYLPFKEDLANYLSKFELTLP
jgi:hypothetical protein